MIFFIINYKLNITMLMSNIEKQNTNIDIKVSLSQSIRVFLNKETGFLSIVKSFNPNTGISTFLLKI